MRLKKFFLLSYLLSRDKLLLLVIWYHANSDIFGCFDQKNTKNEKNLQLGRIQTVN